MTTLPEARPAPHLRGVLAGLNTEAGTVDHQGRPKPRPAPGRGARERQGRRAPRPGAAEMTGRGGRAASESEVKQYRFAELLASSAVRFCRSDSRCTRNCETAEMAPEGTRGACATQHRHHQGYRARGDRPARIDP